MFMVDKVIDITSLQQGDINNNGTDISATNRVRTKNTIDNDLAFTRGELDCEAVILKSWEGSPNGNTLLKIPNCTTEPTYYSDPNYTVTYYWWYIDRETYTSPQGDHLWRVGYIALFIPKPGANAEGNSPYIRSYQCVAYTGTGDNSRGTLYDEINLENNRLVYYVNGEKVITTCAQFVLGTVLYYNEETDNFNYDWKGFRDSEFKPCEVRMLCYSSANNVPFHVIDWTNGKGSINFVEHITIDKWRFVYKVLDNDNNEVNPFKPDHVINSKLKLQANSWFMNNEDSIDCIELTDKINTDIFTDPYPASFWYLDEASLTEMFLLTKRIPGDILTVPYPSSFYWLDDMDVIVLDLQPNSLPLGAFSSCEKLRSIRLPKSLTKIGHESFQETNLSKVTIPNSECTYYVSTFPPNCEVTGGQIKK